MTIVMLAQVFFPDTIGGAGRYLYELAVGLLARGHRVVILTKQVDQTPDEEVLDGLRILRYGPLARWRDIPRAWLAIRGHLRRLAQEQPYDLIAIQQPLPACALLMSRQARRVPWVYHFHSPWAHEFRLMRAARRWDPLGPLLGALMRGVEHQLLLQVCACVTLSRWMKELLLKVHGLPEATVHVVAGCADLERFQPAPQRDAVRQRLGFPQDRAVLLTVRNLVPRMNLDGLIHAMRLVVAQRPDALLMIGGSGPLAHSLQTLIQQVELGGHVRLVGAIADAHLPQWYQAADVFVMPSRALEGFGLATLEALACGTPVVGTPVGGTQELLSALDPSLLCQGVGPEAIASTILRTLDRLREATARQECSARCRDFALRFSQHAMVEALERTYRDAVRVRVLHVHTLPVVSGSGLNTFCSMQGQRDASYDVELACGTHGGRPQVPSREPSRDAPGESLLDLVERAGLVARPMRHLVQPVAPFHDLLAVVELWWLIRAHRYTIVHTHNSKAGLIGRLAAKLAGVPVIVHTVHGFAFHAYERWWRRQLFRALERMAARWCDHLIMISEPLITWALEARIAPREQMTKIYSGIDLSAFQRPVDPASLREEFGFRDQEFIVGQVAKLWPGKGHEVLFRAVARLKDRLPRLRLLVIGEGELRATLRRLAQTLDISDRVIFAGFRSDVAALTHLFDVAVLPSLFEGMGRAILEAQAAGKPVIASRVGGTPDLIRDGVNGVLVEPGDVEALAAALCRLYEQPQLRRALGQTAQQMMDRRFEARTMVEQIIGLYDTLRERKLGMAPRCF